MNPESGTTSYTYLRNGTLQTKTDARGVTVTYIVDGLSRVKRKDYTATVPATPGVRYCYDGDTYNNATDSCDTDTTRTADYAQGALTHAVARNGSAIVSETKYTEIDAMGRITASVQKTPGLADMPFVYQYGNTGQLIAMQYPSGRWVTYDINGADQVKAVRKGQTGTNYYLEQATYKADGSLASAMVGLGGPANEWSEAREYNSRLQARKLQVQKGGQTLLGLNWVYASSYDSAYQETGTDNNGRLQYEVLQYPSGGLPQTVLRTYTYDGAKRVSNYSEPGKSQGYGYDAFGNVWQNGAANGVPPLRQNGSSWYLQPDGSVNNRMNSVGYDSAGNQTQLSLTAGTTAFYDAENRLAKVDAGGNTLVIYEYDGEGRRVKRIVGAATTYYVYDADGQLMAEYGSTVASTTTLYPVTDYLGSKRMVLDAQGGCKERIDYAPFGAQVMRTGQDCYSGSTNTDMPLFTGTMREDQTKADTQTGLDHMEARQYWASLGRFTSPDEPLSDQDTADPQSWNLYSYVRNNPLRFKDPTGLVCVVDPETGEEHNDDNPGQSCEDAHRDPLGGQIAVDEQGFAITLIGGIIYEVDEEGDRFPIAERSLQDTSLDVFATMRLAKAALGSVVREAPYLLADETGTFGGGGGWRSLANKVRLPTRGRFRFIHQKGRSAAQGFVRTSEGGFVDRFGNVWIRPKVPGATADEIHWGVQLSPAGKASWGRFSNSGSHVNVTVDGRITH